MQMIFLLIPPEMLVLLLAAGGIAMIVGAKRLASSLIVGAIALAVLPAFLASLFGALHAPLLLLITVAMAIGIFFAVLRFLSDATIGRRPTDHMIGILAADSVRGAARGVIGIVGWALRGAWRVVTLPFR